VSSNLTRSVGNTKPRQHFRVGRGFVQLMRGTDRCQFPVPVPGASSRCQFPVPVPISQMLLRSSRSAARRCRDMSGEHVALRCFAGTQVQLQQGGSRLPPAEVLQVAEWRMTIPVRERASQRGSTRRAQTVRRAYLDQRIRAVVPYHTPSRR
jgi:hypothetical protein